MKIKAILVVLVLLIIFSSVAFADFSRITPIPVETPVPPTGDVVFLGQGEIVQVYCSGNFLTLETFNSTQVVVYCSTYYR